MERVFSKCRETTAVYLRRGVKDNAPFLPQLLPLFYGWSFLYCAFQCVSIGVVFSCSFFAAPLGR